MPENTNTNTQFIDAEDTVDMIQDCANELDTSVESPVLAYVNGRFYPIISAEANDDEGWIVLNVGTQEVKPES